jgi:alpha-ketoglutarate-dependent taurine dioxygenase
VEDLKEMRMPDSQMLTTPVTDARGWSANTIDDAASWSYSLSDTCLSAFDRFINDHRRYPQTLSEIEIGRSDLDACVESLKPVCNALNSGRGFAIIERVPVEKFTVDEARAVYWLIGRCLGTPFAQDIKGTLLYDVRDTGQNVTQGARFSVTNAESSFHTDNSFNPRLPDFVGLLCLQTAKSGGRSQLISGYTLHNGLLKNHAELLETFYQPFYFDRRGQFSAGESPVSQSPIFDWNGAELTTRYMHYYIEVGHERAGQKLNPAQAAALNALEALLRRPDFRVEFSLKPGQMLFTNNRWILHNRTAFADYPELEQRRHLVRLWLRREG